MMRALAVAAAIACGAGCGGDPDPIPVTVTTTMFADQIGTFVELTGTSNLRFDPLASAPTGDGDGFQVTIADDASIPLEGYRVDPLDGASRSFVVHAHDVLGAQYGLAAALENLGYRFRHPDDVLVPNAPSSEGLGLGVVHQPQTRVRGFQFHTLHPIESHYALIMGDLDASLRIIDWTIKNRGNYIQWVILDDILDPTRGAEWTAFTRQVIDAAHARGVRVGVNIQLFGKSNLQAAFDLVDEDQDPVPAQIAARLPIVTALPWDVYDLSFGEFFDAEPQPFVNAVNEVASQLRTLAPNAEMHATVHVGGTQRVMYMNQDIPYYFLVKFADPAIVPEIHSVMYYDLFESAGGAYQYEGPFDEHRQYLVDRLCAQQKVAYFPETAYWIAFDNSVPLFLPLYVKNRWFDLSGIRTTAAPPPCAPLDEHLIFSSGWEWSYWLHDTTSLRASYELPSAPVDLIYDEYLADLGPDAAQLVADLADAQHTGLMDDKLAAYFSGRDALIDAGRMLGVISQPDRTTFDDLVAGDATLRGTFDATIMASLQTHADQLDDLADRADHLSLPDTRWSRELRQGVQVDRVRARFVLATYRAVLDHLAGDDAAAMDDRADAQDALDEATQLVHDRDGDLHDPDAKHLLVRGANRTVYGYGYLFTADTMCYWLRELDQVDAILTNTDVTPPACVL